MAKNPNQKLKLLYLYRILTERTDEDHKMTMEQLLSALLQYGIEAERKSVYDDITALQDYGLDVILQRGRGGGYYVGGREFELAELKLLVDAIQCSRFITERKSTALIHKVESLASIAQARELQRQVYVSGRVKTMNESIYYNIDKLHSAIASGYQVSFRYFQWELDFSSPVPVQKQYRREGCAYTASPWAMTWDDENYYLVAYDPAAEELRHYRVDKMDHISVLNVPREGKQFFKEHFDVASYTGKMFGMFSGAEETVRLLCENRFIGVLRDRFGADLMVHKVDDTHFSVQVTVAVSPQFFSWVFGLGGGVHILSPESVQQAFRSQLNMFLDGTDGQ